MPIRVASAPVTWGIMEVEGWTPPIAPSTFLDELKAAGYDSTELGPYGYLPTDPACLSLELRRRNLQLISAFVPIPLKEPDAGLAPLRAVAQVLHFAGARHVVLADALWPEREAVAGRAGEAHAPRLSGDDWSVVTANLQAAIAAAREFQLRSVFHHHAGTYIETPGEIARLLDCADIGLCLDTGHYAYGGGDPLDAIARYGVRIEYLHFKDVDPARLDQARRNHLGFLDAVRAGVFCPLGQGSVRFPEILAALHHIGYDGWAVVEQDVDSSGPASSTPFENARASREYLRSLGI